MHGHSYKFYISKSRIDVCKYFFSRRVSCYFIAGSLYLHVMRILTVFPHSNGCCTEVILVVLFAFCIIYCFAFFFYVYRSALCDTSLSG